MPHMNETLFELDVLQVKFGHSNTYGEDNKLFFFIGMCVSE